MADAPSWHWCPACRLASSRPGPCPGCGADYQQVSEHGVPDEPFRPRLPRTGGFLAGAASVILVTALLAGAAFGVFQLASHGQSATGSPEAAASPSAQASAAAAAQNSCTKGVACTFEVSALGTTITLQGAWTENDAVGEDVATAVSEVAAPVFVDLSVAGGDADLGIVHVSTTNPAGATNELFSVLTAVNQDGQGHPVIWDRSRPLSIDGHPANAEDFIIQGANSVISDGSYYALALGTGDLLVAEVEAAQQATKDKLEAALVQM
ncbi:MAG TPA: hypothetical protein VEK76_13115 [Candidatus Binatia bacterium]|nr:hypothetical protein [Candidatus Binatia bacterium]